LFSEYTSYVNGLINLLWDKRNVYKNHKYLDRLISDSVPTWLSARLKQAAGKRALEIIRAQARRDVDSKPIFKGHSIELDLRFNNLKNSSNSFDMWLHLQSLGNKIILDIPLKRHKHFLKFADWSRKKSIRLRHTRGKLYVDFFFESPDLAKKQMGSIVAFDLGINKLICTSQGIIIGTELKAKIKKTYHRKQGSKNWHNGISEIRNYIGQSVNSFDLLNIAVLVREDLTGLIAKRNGKNNQTTRKLLSFWMRSLFDLRLANKCELNRVKQIFVEPKNTSIECPKCHCIDKRNRQGESFQCVKCKHAGDADLDIAPLNILDRYRQSIAADVCKN
jgi:transposase